VIQLVKPRTRCLVGIVTRREDGQTSVVEAALQGGLVVINRTVVVVVEAVVAAVDGASLKGAVKRMLTHTSVVFDIIR